MYAMERELGITLVPWRDNSFEGVHSFCAHFPPDNSRQLSFFGKNDFFLYIYIYIYIYIFRVTRHSLGTSAIICRLSINCNGCYSLWFWVNLAFFLDWSQIVMRLQRWHQPLDHLEEEYQPVSFLLSWSGGKLRQHSCNTSMFPSGVITGDKSCCLALNVS